MNKEQLASLLRTVLQIAGTFIVSKGWADGGTVETVGGALVILIVTAYGLVKRSNTGLVASAASVPSVSRIITDHETAAATTSSKVVTG